MSKVLVVYATKSGCTAEIAEHIAATLAGRGVEADVAVADQAGDPSGYDAVVLGSGVRGGTWHLGARTWALAHAEQLRSMPVALFTCGLVITAGAEKTEQVRAYTDALIEQTGITPVDIGLFAGWNDPSAFPFVERSIMKLMKAPQGDFRDFSAIARWADDTAERLGLVR